MNRFQLARTPVETVESHQRSGRFCWRAVAGWLAGIAFLALPLLAQDSAGSVDGIYRGAIGNQAIVVELSGPLDGAGVPGENYADTDDRQTYPIHGSYFYRRYGVSIPLVGMPLGDGIVRLREYKHVVRDDEFTAEWRLTMREGKATGTFCKCDLSQPSASAGPRLKVSLTRVSQKLTPAFNWFRDDYKPHSGYTYYDLLLDFPLQPGPEIEVTPEIAYRMQKDPRFKVSMPRLTRFPNAGVMARINRDLDADFTGDRFRAAVFSAGPGAECNSFYETTTAVNFLPPDVLSVLVESQWFSCGAHPNEGGYSHNYNLHTGKRFALEEAFQTSSGSAAQAESAAVLGKLYLRHYVKPPYKEVPFDDCEQIVREIVSGKDVPFSPLLSLSQKGLVIDPPLPHLVKDCGPAVTVPYRELRPFVKRGSTLRLLVDTRTANK